MAKKKNSTTVTREFWDSIKNLPNEERLNALDSIMVSAFSDGDFTGDVADELIDHIRNLSGINYRNVESNRRQARARLKEGWTKEQLMKIVEVKAYEWKGTTMEKHLNPVTLFRKSHVDNYWAQVELAGNDRQRFNKIFSKDNKQNGQSAESHAREFAEKVKRQFDYIDEHFGKPKQSCNL